jgi:hypothetical protein
MKFIVLLSGKFAMENSLILAGSVCNGKFRLPRKCHNLCKPQVNGRITERSFRADAVLMLKTGIARQISSWAGAVPDFFLWVGH